MGGQVLMVPKMTLTVMTEAPEDPLSGTFLKKAFEVRARKLEPKRRQASR